MKTTALAALVLAATAVAGAQGVGPAAGPPDSEWRQAIGASFSYEPQPPAPPIAALDPSAAQADQADPGVIRMTTLTVRDSTLRFDDLHDAIVKAGRAERSAEIASKLGIGVHAIRMRKVTLFASTILYIPVSFGLAW